MLIVLGSYRVAPKLVADRNDWCNHCDRPVLAQQWRSFYLGHVYWIPFLPLGFYKTWAARSVARTPELACRLQRAVCVTGLLVLSLMFAVSLSGPYSGEAAPAVCVSRLVLGTLVLNQA